MALPWHCQRELIATVRLTRAGISSLSLAGEAPAHSTCRRCRSSICATVSCIPFPMIRPDAPAQPQPRPPRNRQTRSVRTFSRRGNRRKLHAVSRSPWANLLPVVILVTQEAAVLRAVACDRALVALLARRNARQQYVAGLLAVRGRA